MRETEIRSDPIRSDAICFPYFAKKKSPKYPVNVNHLEHKSAFKHSLIISPLYRDMAAAPIMMMIILYGFRITITTIHRFSIE